MIYPPLKQNFSFPKIILSDDKGQLATLTSLIENGKELTLLIPGFTTCHGVCPVLTRLYKEILSDPSVSDSASKVSALFFSFDTNDTRETLAHFRKHAGLSENWVLTHSTPESTQALLSSLQYTVMKSESGFQHPAQAYVFTKELKWVGSLYGTDVTPSEFQQIVEQASFQKDYPRLSSIVGVAANPDIVAVTAGLGFFVSILLISWLAIRMTKK